MFWGECLVAKCSIEKDIEHCGLCAGPLPRATARPCAMILFTAVVGVNRSVAALLRSLLMYAV
jgi:hypothetical protein